MSDLLRNRNRLVKRKTPTFILWLGVIIGIALFASSFVEAISLSTVWRSKTAVEGTIMRCEPKRIIHDFLAPPELVVRYPIHDERGRTRVDARGRQINPEIRTFVGNWR